MAKKSAPKRASKVKTKNDPKTLFQTFIGGFIAGVICCAIGLQLLQNRAQPSPPEKVEVEANVNQVDLEKEEKPEITFHRILRDAEVLVPVPAPEEPRKKVIYFLQAASFRDSQDANAARAEIILLNLEAEISQSNVNGETWYRIIVGPFEGRSNVSKAQTTLLENGYGGMVLQREK